MIVPCPSLTFFQFKTLFGLITDQGLCLCTCVHPLRRRRRLQEQPGRWSRSHTYDSEKSEIKKEESCVIVMEIAMIENVTLKFYKSVDTLPMIAINAFQRPAAAFHAKVGDIPSTPKKSKLLVITFFFLFFFFPSFHNNGRRGWVEYGKPRRLQR